MSIVNFKRVLVLFVYVALEKKNHPGKKCFKSQVINSTEVSVL